MLYIEILSNTMDELALNVVPKEKRMNVLFNIHRAFQNRLNTMYQKKKKPKKNKIQKSELILQRIKYKGLIFRN